MRAGSEHQIRVGPAGGPEPESSPLAWSSKTTSSARMLANGAR